VRTAHARRQEEHERWLAEEERVRQRALREGRYRVSRVAEFEEVGGMTFLGYEAEPAEP
jgi:hypothetical protein